MNFLETLRNIWAIEDLRKRVLFTFGLLAIYRLGSHIPTPGVDPVALSEFFKAMSGGVFGFLDLFSGGALRRLSVFALGIMPYISASIILQLLTVVWPYLEKLSKEGELGRRKITQYTRYGTIFLSVVQALGIAIFLERQTNVTGGLPLVYHPGIAFRLMTVLTLTTGTSFIMCMSMSTRADDKNSTVAKPWLKVSAACRRSIKACGMAWPAELVAKRCSVSFSANQCSITWLGNST